MPKAVVLNEFLVKVDLRTDKPDVLVIGMWRIFILNTIKYNTDWPKCYDTIPSRDVETFTVRSANQNATLVDVSKLILFTGNRDFDVRIKNTGMLMFSPRDPHRNPLESGPEPDNVDDDDDNETVCSGETESWDMVELF